MKIGVVLGFALLVLMLAAPAQAQPPQPQIVDTPNVKILTGLYAQQFQEEMNFITQAQGVNCNTCHVRGNFASEEKPLKLTARRMLEMTKMINTQFFPDHKPK